MKATIEFDEDAKHELGKIVDELVRSNFNINEIENVYEEYIEERISELFKEFIKNMNIYDFIDHKIALTNAEYLENMRKQVKKILSEEEEKDEK